MEGKTCNGGCYCQYKVLGGTFLGCNYSGYCDFQAPRDSRNKELYSEKQKKFQEEYEQDRNS